RRRGAMTAHSDLRLIKGSRVRGGIDDRPCIVHVLGSRADAVRAEPVIAALDARGLLRQVIVRAGGPDDGGLPSDDSLRLGLPEADHILPAPGGTHAEQVAGLLTALENVMLAERPLVAMTSGDSNAALACGLVAAKLGLALARAEAGQRSWEWSRPEEINR